MDNNELLTAIKGMIDPISSRLEKLEKDNQELKGQVDAGAVRVDSNTSGHRVNMQAARSVTIQTRPVLDSPDDPRWGGKVAVLGRPTTPEDLDAQ